MAPAPTRYAMGLATVVAFAACVGGCVSALSGPDLDEQAAALHATRFSPITRYAVATRGSSFHAHPSQPMGDRVSAEVAEVVAKRLGIRAIALSHETGTGWSNELDRGYGATGWFKMSDNEDFFRNAGFDGYVLITLFEETENYDGSKGHDNGRKFLTFDPVYHMFALPRDQKKVLLMRAGLDGRYSCETDGERLENEAVCVDTVVKRFRRKLEARLEQSDENQG